MVSLAGILTTLGLLLLIHTTYAVIKHHELLKLLQEEYNSLPLPLLAELLAGCGLSLLGGFMLSGTLRPALMTKLGGSSDAFRHDFVNFNTRAKAFFQGQGLPTAS
mmetsp:Transcript_11724/g.20858  ORF Transcript_11724/g.20858 Transcript_11724/m.20858 type:complete len:106 (-) Transcript_11724:514-831(-)